MNLRIAEIFGPTIQGEGALIGKPSVFVRAGGCDFRCSWCDSLHAVDSQYRANWIPMTAEAIWLEVQRLSNDKPLTVSLSGGNPAIQDSSKLIRIGTEHSYEFACETQGSKAASWFSDLSMLALSPKPPSSQETMNWNKFEECLDVRPPNTCLKIVVFDASDFNWARDVADRYPNLPVFLQPGNSNVDPQASVDLTEYMRRLQWLICETLAARWFEARVLPQLHVQLWGNERGK